MGILERWRESRGIAKVEEMNPEERAVYERYERVLADGEISVDKIAQFCENQCKVIEKQWKNLDNSAAKNERLIIFHTVYQTILEAIRAPETQREALEKHLQSQIDQA